MNANNPPAPQADAALQQVTLATEARGWRLDRALAQAIPTLSRERLKALVSAGAVHVDGRLERDPARKMQGGEAVTAAIPQPRPAAPQPQDIPLDIIFEDPHLLIVDKPAGLVVHPAAGNPDGTLVNALLHHCAGRLPGIGDIARPGIVHRLDKDTSGLLVVAKTLPAYRHLAQQFRSHSIQRQYLAVVAGQPAPPAGRIETHLGRSARNRQKMAVVPAGSGRLAITHYRTRQIFDRAALVECRLETGRTHQIRVHMAHIGHPLLGDPFYGQGRLRELCRRIGFDRQALHSAALRFEHPISHAMLQFESPLPADIQALLIALQ